MINFSLASSNFQGVVYYVLNLINLLIPILFAFALLFFFWGLSKFILSAGNQAENEKGKNYMLWGVLVLFILFSFRGIIGLVSNELFDNPAPDAQSVLLPLTQ